MRDTKSPRNCEKRFILHVRYLEPFVITASGYTDKKENKIFLIYREIKMGSGAKSNMRKGFLIYEEMHKYFHHIYEEAVRLCTRSL